MAKQLLAKEVTAAMAEKLKTKVARLHHRNVIPTLAILRCGENAADISYERSALKRAEEIGVAVKKVLLPENVSKRELLERIDELNEDSSVHGVLLFRPLPNHLWQDEDEICSRLSVEKDIDGMTNLSCAGVFTGKNLGFPPCTPCAVIALLDHYGIECGGKSVCVIGRSLVVGRPVAMLLLQRNATVTVCHTKTKNTAELARNADIIITAAGVPGFLTENFVSPGQTVIDVSVNWVPDKPTPKGMGGFSGDAEFEKVAPIVDAITPVPGGVGGITAAVLISHVVEAAERTHRENSE